MRDVMCVKANQVRWRRGMNGNLPSPRLRRAGWWEPFDLKDLTWLWVVLGCAFGPWHAGGCGCRRKVASCLYPNRL